jgi:hypothetical protein
VRSLEDSAEEEKAMQRIMETLLERRGLALWMEDRLLRLLKNGATVHMARGYADYVYRRERNYMSMVGDPLAGGSFAAEQYRGGYELAAHELGDLTMSNVIG